MYFKGKKGQVGNELLWENESEDLDKKNSSQKEEYVGRQCTCCRVAAKKFTLPLHFLFRLF